MLWNYFLALLSLLIRILVRRKLSENMKDTPPVCMAEAVDAAVRTGRMTERKAAEHYGITRSRLQNHLSGKHQGSCGHPISLTKIEEQELALTLDSVAEWGFPLNKMEVRILVKGYCDRRRMKRFKNNLPSEDWVKAFINRTTMVKRAAGNIKRARASVDETAVWEMFSNIDHLILLPTHIWNYDETNVTDNPLAKTVIVRRGIK